MESKSIHTRELDCQSEQEDVKPVRVSTIGDIEIEPQLVGEPQRNHRAYSGGYEYPVFEAQVSPESSVK